MTLTEKKMKKDFGANYFEEVFSEDSSFFNVVKEGLEDLNLYVSEIENMYRKLENNITEDDYNMLRYKLSILEKNMTELNGLISAVFENIGNIDKSKLS